MSFDEIQSGSIIIYPYLWNRESSNGETEGRKPRETVVAVRLERSNKQDLLVLLPITSQQPEPPALCFELPETEIRRIGRGDKGKLWIILHEYNTDIIGRSWYLEPDSSVGSLSPKVYAEMMVAFRTAFASAKAIPRRPEEI